MHGLVLSMKYSTNTPIKSDAINTMKKSPIPFEEATNMSVTVKLLSCLKHGNGHRIVENTLAEDDCIQFEVNFENCKNSDWIIR